MASWKVTTESGLLNLGDKIISVRLIKDILEKYNRISVFEEKADFVKCRIFRINRIFGAPWLGPYPSVSFQIERKYNETVLHYNYRWPEYYLVVIGSVFIGFASGASTCGGTGNILSGIKDGVFFFLVSALVFSIAIFLDVSYYKRLLHKELMKK